MTAKEQKFINLISSAAVLDLPHDSVKFNKVISDLITFDYASAVLLWEYYLTDKDREMSKSDALASMLTDGVEKVFESKAGSRFLKLLTDSAVIRDALYRRSASALSRSETIGYAAQLMISGKPESDELLKSAFRNAGGNFGAFMAAVVDRLIIELSRKNPAKPSFPKKLATQVLSFSEKIKGPEKAFIAQRIREL